MWDSIEEKDKKKLHPMAVSVAEGALVELQERRRSLEAALEQKGEPPGILSEILSIEQECAANVSKKNNIASRVREIQSTLDQLTQKSASLRAALDEQASAISIRILD